MLAIVGSLRNIQNEAVNSLQFDKSFERDRITKVITTASERRRLTSEQRKARQKVQKILKDFRPSPFAYPNVNKDNLLQYTYDLIKRIEPHGTAHQAVNPERFYRVVEEGQDLTWALRVVIPKGAVHAVALVGYSVSDDKFLIKDSNKPYLIEMSPQNLFLSLLTGTVLVHI
jgi:hypothetical protein